ncbi:hybrid sensor histidine kinase/response regulator [Chitinolyticbacter albus]|uniref:hybrid sensor histidine kinase/response regulator n=1 Tax=Chitinolyticbacter albus TaxID=2961951 RepID=UPI00210AF064|nr:hybrid sensor histidine kinase/response regulator [Chitinolyticbacter albus]
MQSYANLVVLVVDDFEPMRKVTTTQLRTLGVDRVITAGNGAEALRALTKNRVDIVLSDWNMPSMNGLELLKAIRGDEALRRIPFVMITAETERRRIEEVIACGVSDLLVKPYSPDRFAAAFEKALKWKERSSKPAPLETEKVKSADIQPPQPPQPQAQDADRASLLIVDDTPDNLMLLSQLFKEEYRVRIAHNGQKALDLCMSAEPPDLVLLDVMMPGMDGFAVAQRMREIPATQAIPVIFVTALAEDAARLQGLNLGAVDFVTKPIQPDHLRLRVGNFVRYVMLRKQLQADYDNMLEVARLRDDVEHLTRHDMKGALAGVISMVQALVASEQNYLRGEQLRTVEETMLNLLNMSNLTSDLYKIETGRFELNAKEINIVELLRRIVELARSSFAHKKLTIAVDTDVAVGAPVPQASGDAMLSYSVFQNLIKNACEAAPEGSRVEVRLLDQNPLRIEIENKGAVPATIRDHFFDKYVTHGKQGGTGLGTYSAKLLIEAQGGSIELTVQDDENRTQIAINLPRWMPPQ